MTSLNTTEEDIAKIVKPYLWKAFIGGLIVGALLMYLDLKVWGL